MSIKKQVEISFYDFDGSLVDSQTPLHGKDIWAKYHQKPYPHIGWWSKPESLCMKAFTNKPKEEVHSQYKIAKSDANHFNYLLTSRLPRLKKEVIDILDSHGITMDEYFFASDKNKGEKIYDEVQKMLIAYDVKKVTVYEDRMKEVKVIEEFREKLKELGVELKIVKIESDADANDQK